jgi:predicted secreted protein
MKNTNLTFAGGVLAAWIICAGAMTPAWAQKTVTIGGDDNYSNQSLTVGDSLVVKLKVDRSSGYSWTVAPLEGNVLQQEPVKPKPPLSTEVFKFNATGPGAVTLTLNNVKKADPTHPLQIYSVMVGVNSQAGQEKSTYVVGHFSGTLPCADCTGLLEDITFYALGPNQFIDTIFKRKMTYVDAPGGNKVNEDSGPWALLPGTATDPSASVYALFPDDPAKVEYYWLKSTDELVPLDKDKKVITGPKDMTLRLEK